MPPKDFMNFENFFNKNLKDFIKGVNVTFDDSKREKEKEKEIEMDRFKDYIRHLSDVKQHIQEQEQERRNRIFDETTIDLLAEKVAEKVAEKLAGKLFETEGEDEEDVQPNCEDCPERDTCPDAVTADEEDETTHILIRGVKDDDGKIKITDVRVNGEEQDPAEFNAMLEGDEPQDK